jgi:hypothetical protein
MILRGGCKSLRIVLSDLILVSVELNLRVVHHSVIQSVSQSNFSYFLTLKLCKRCFESIQKEIHDIL